MDKKEKVRNYYEKGLWSLAMTRNAVGRWITESDFEEITGETYRKDGGK